MMVIANLMMKIIDLELFLDKLEFVQDELVSGLGLQSL